MTNEERQIGRIKAILSASEEVISRVKKLGDRNTEIMAMETAYERIKGIVDDTGYCPWAE